MLEDRPELRAIEGFLVDIVKQIDPVVLAEKLGLPPMEAEEIGYSSMMHDVGKMNVPDAVLKKVIHALESKRPKAHYYVTFPTYLFAYLKRLLPTKLLDKLLNKI